METTEFTTYTVRLDAEDSTILQAARTAEKLSASDILRRALRHYAAEVLRIEPPKPKRPKR